MPSTRKALGPLYPTKAVNADVELYTGRMSLGAPGSVAPECDGRIVLRWGAHPALAFEIAGGSIADEARLSIASLGASTEVFVQEHSANQICGVVRRSLDVRADGPVASAVFHLPNFPQMFGETICAGEHGAKWAGRIHLEVDGWQVQLDAVREHHEVIRAIERVNGHAFTHVGLLRRKDGGMFTRKETDHFTTFLWQAFSFLRAGWTCPMLVVGFTEKGERAWESWAAGRTSSGKPVMGALDLAHASTVQEALTAFSLRWQEPEWKSALSWALMLYVEAHNGTPGIEVSTVLAQSAMELLASFWIRRHRTRLVRGKSSPKSSADKIALVIRDCGVEDSIPPRLPELLRIAKKEGWKNGPSAIAEPRNYLVHGNHQNTEILDRTSTDARGDAWLLSLWYLDLMLLRVLGYNGAYSNRLRTDRITGTVDPVPWSKPQLVRP